MKPSTLLVAFAATQAVAYPGMDRVLGEIQARTDIEERSTELLGDLINGALSAVGNTIKSILQGVSAVGDRSTYKAPGALGSDQCNKDTCCVWSYITTEMQAAFTDSAGCTALARGAIRQGFHDAAAWNKTLPEGGADGSLLLSDSELSRFENLPLAEIAAQTKAWFAKYKQYGIGMADLIQTGATVATVSCPQGPRIRTFVGRTDSSKAAPPRLLPSPFQSAQDLIDLFAAKTFTASDLVALVGAHTVSRQTQVDPSRAGTPQDSTPAVWDTKFYSQTLANDNQTILTFPSDKNLATYSKTSGQWNAFAGPAGPATWGPAFASAYFRMSMLGVKNMNALTECTKVVPLPR